MTHSFRPERPIGYRSGRPRDVVPHARREDTLAELLVGLAMIVGAIVLVAILFAAFGTEVGPCRT